MHRNNFHVNVKGTPSKVNDIHIYQYLNILYHILVKLLGPWFPLGARLFPSQHTHRNGCTNCFIILWMAVHISGDPKIVTSPFFLSHCFFTKLFDLVFRAGTAMVCWLSIARLFGASQLNLLVSRIHPCDATDGLKATPLTFLHVGTSLRHLMRMTDVPFVLDFYETIFPTAQWSAHTCFVIYGQYQDIWCNCILRKFSDAGNTSHFSGFY